MAIISNIISVSVNNTVLLDFVKGSLIQTINSYGFPTGNPIRDKNIQYFWQQGYEAKKLVNMLNSYLVGRQEYDLTADAGVIQTAVDNNWTTIFDLPLI